MQNCSFRHVSSPFFISYLGPLELHRQQLQRFPSPPLRNHTSCTHAGHLAANEASSQMAEVEPVDHMVLRVEVLRVFVKSNKVSPIDEEMRHLWITPQT